MRASTVGHLLLSLRLVVGLMAVVGLFVGFEPTRLSMVLLKLAVYKLAYVAAFSLLVAGAAVRRRELLGPTNRRPADEQRMG